MAVVTLVSVMSIAAEAASVTLAKLNLGYMVPTNSKGTKTIETVKLYGDYDYINFYINSKKKDACFFYEIYSDSDCTKLVEGDVAFCNKGEYSLVQKIKLKKKYKSKTYYMVTYAGKIYSDGSAKIDKKSMREFQIKVDRKADFDEKVVVLKETKNTTKGAYIKWGKLGGASKYEIYRRSITGTKWKKVGTVSSKKDGFTDTSVKNKNGNYIYSVKAVNKKGVKSRMLYAGLICLFAKTPVMESACVVGDNTIQVKWNSTQSDAKYIVMRKAGKGSWETLKTNYSGTTYNDKTAVNGKIYTYSVKAVISTDYGKTTSSYYANADKSVKYLEAPIMNELEIAENEIGLSWGSVKGATGYSVLRKPLDSDDEWTVLEKVSSDVTSYVDTNVSLTDSAYLYTVRSEGNGFRGSYSSGKEYFTLAQPDFDVSVDDSVQIKWNKVQYATSYRIFEQQDDGSWDLKAKTKKTSYEFEPSMYYNKKISVCAVRNGIESPYKTDVDKVEFFPQITPEFKELDNYTDIKWNATLADSYRVYRKLKDAPDSEYELFYENRSCTFSNGSPENDVAYTYQIRGVYGGVEQYNNLVSKTHIRYSPETCIKSFKAYKEIEVFNRQYKSSDIETTSYHFDVDKTDAFKKSAVKFYYWGNAYAGEGWAQTSGYSYVEDYEAAYDLVKPARFCCVVSTNSGNSTPLGVNTIYVEEETCKAPEITLTPTSKGLKMTWNAVDDAVAYDVAVYFSKRDDYKKTFKADGSKTYTINFDNVSYDYNIYLWVSAIHENGNVTTRRIDDYSVYPKPKLIKAVAKNDNIQVIWDGADYEGYFAVLRKAEGESKWTCVSKKYYESKWCTTIDGKEYTGFVYTDKKTKKGKKYTYTVRIYNPQTKEYVSYYNTKGVSAKR